MKLETGKSYTANTEYTNLMNKERRLQKQIAELEKELRATTAKKQQTEAWVAA